MDGRETGILNLRRGPWNTFQGIFLPAVAVWLSGTREFNMQPQTWQKVGTKVESAVSCPGGGPFLEEGWHPGTRGDGQGQVGGDP